MTSEVVISNQISDSESRILAALRYKRDMEGEEKRRSTETEREGWKGLAP